jgi:hypothetical protein
LEIPILNLLNKDNTIHDEFVLMFQQSFNIEKKNIVSNNEENLYINDASMCYDENNSNNTYLFKENTNTEELLNIEQFLL